MKQGMSEGFYVVEQIHAVFLEKLLEKLVVMGVQSFDHFNVSRVVDIYVKIFCHDFALLIECNLNSVFGGFGLFEQIFVLNRGQFGAVSVPLNFNN